MKRFVINRATWANANTTNESMLLNPKTGLMCCLGQICHQAKTPKKELAFKYEPSEIGIRVNYLDDLLKGNKEFAWPSVAPFVRHWFADVAMNINDNEMLTPRERERELKNLFKDKGIELSFVGRLPRMKLTD